MNVFRFIPGYEEEIFRAGKEPLLLLLISFLLSFALTRLYTRLARRHGWGAAGSATRTSTTWCRGSCSSSSAA